jgi:histidinol-phosphatase
MASDTADPRKLRLDWAVKIAHEAGRHTLKYFRRGDLEVERKADDSPVTIADREAEELLRLRIAERFPADGLLGEELGAIESKSGYQWVLDPIDGTKSFIRGVPLYSTLVAVLLDGEPCIGVIHAPATSETVYADTGGGSWYLPGKGQQPRQAQVSRVSRMQDSLVLTSEVANFAKRLSGDTSDVFHELEHRARLARTWGDGYGYLMVATGRAEVMIDAVMNLWDAAPLQPILEEAGGRFSDWQGRATVHSGDAIATNGLIADEVLTLTKGR